MFFSFLCVYECVEHYVQIFYPSKCQKLENLTDSKSYICISETTLIGTRGNKSSKDLAHHLAASSFICPSLGTVSFFSMTAVPNETPESNMLGVFIEE